MPRAYSSQDSCPVARALDVVGDRWTLLVLRELLLAPRKFSELLELLNGISPNLLAERLKMLKSAALLEQQFYSEHPPRARYSLTEKGRALGPVVHGLASWGVEYEFSDAQKADPQVADMLARLGAIV